MLDVVEELMVEPHRVSRPTRLLLGCLLTALVALSLLAGSTVTPACRQPTASSGPQTSARPWAAPDDPAVRNLHFAALDRRRQPGDEPPRDILPTDVHRAARKLGDSAGVAVYLARGLGFACLGVDGRAGHYDSASVCLLDTTIANQGLKATVHSDGAEEPLLIVAVPDGAGVLTTSTVVRVAEYASVVVLRPGQDRVLLQQLRMPAIVVSQENSQPSQTSPPC